MQTDGQRLFYETKAKAERGDTEAQFNMGLMYYHGRGIPQDDPNLPKPPEGFQRIEASSRFPVIYDAREVAPIDFQEAYIWFYIAGENGHKEAAKYRECSLKKLSYMLPAMQEAPRRHRKIQINKYSRAARQGDADAQFRLSVAYAEDRGNPESEKEGGVWFAVAALSGNKKAIEILSLDGRDANTPPSSEPELSWHKEAKIRYAQIKSQ